jgi:hypothetical protein
MVIDLGEQPTPEVEPAEPPPGGTDAVADVEHEPDPVVPDLTGLGNSTSRDAPDELTEADGADAGSGSDGASETDQEAPA